MENAIEIENLSKSYSLTDFHQVGIKAVLLHLPHYLSQKCHARKFQALKDVSVSVAKGQALGVIGPNGSGKSTLLGLIAGVIRPTVGSVTVRGRIGPLLELGAGFCVDLTGRENILLNGIMLGETRRQMLARTAQIIDFSELGEFIDRPLRTYSSGMVVRLAFSIACQIEPEILLVDEVLAVGDMTFQEKCRDRMERFRKNGTTTVLVSHSTDQIRSFCDSALYIEHGCVRYRGNDVGEAIRLYQRRCEENMATQAAAIKRPALQKEST
jgi:lipopolysaccharide transport system ATP-binding protein